MKKFFVNLLIIIYFCIAIAVTVCLISYNEYKVSQIGNKTLILSTDEELDEIANRGDLLIVEKSKNKDLNVGDKVFFYAVEGDEVTISAAKITMKDDKYSKNIRYIVEGDYKLSDKYIIGKVDQTTTVPHLGSILKFLESRLVFLFLIVFPSFIAFLYEGYKVIMEIKYGQFEEI